MELRIQAIKIFFNNNQIIKISIIEVINQIILIPLKLSFKNKKLNFNKRALTAMKIIKIYLINLSIIQASITTTKNNKISFNKLNKKNNLLITS